MKVLVIGSSGFLGSALVPALRERGHEVVRLLRQSHRAEPDSALWNPENKEIDESAFNGIGGVIHLAGANIGSRRWTARTKEQLRSSRTNGTSLLVETISKMAVPPRAMVSASAVGYYGSQGDTWLEESSPPGTNFLAEICRQWEVAAAPVATAGVRLVLARLGVVINRDGGALKQMLLPFRLGLGGPVGDGLNYISWIARTDAVRAITHLLENKNVSGPVNLVAPNPATNAELSETLARTLHRPAFLRIPKMALLLIYGEMAEQTILSSMRVKAEKLMRSGFGFTYPELAQALREELS